MMKLEKKQIINLLEALPSGKNVSEVEQNLKELRKKLLNGANTWIEYSENGRALFQAWFLIKNVIREAAHQYFNQ